MNLRAKLAIVLLAITSILLSVEVHRLRKDVDALIELNHDKSEYIDGGCHGRYQGTEEMLPSEATR